MGSAEVFVVLAVTAFDLAVVPGSKDLDPLVVDAELRQRSLKQRRTRSFGRDHPIGKLTAVVRLHALNREGKTLDTMSDEGRGGICIVLLERLQITETAVFVNEGVLVVMIAVLFGILYGSADEAGSRNVFDVDLDALPRISHLFIGLCDILRIQQLHHALFRPPRNPKRPEIVR